jgi:hypothetical protein
MMNRKQRETMLRLLDARWIAVGYTGDGHPLFERGCERCWIDDRGSIWALPIT